MAKTCDRIVLVSAADDRYALPLAVMLSSVRKHLIPLVTLHVYILDGGISGTNKNRILASVDTTHIHLEWVRPRREDVSGLPVFGHVKVSTYFRLLIPKLLPDTIAKAIYLDADCLALGDLCELWSADIMGYPLLAVPEKGMTVSSPELPGYKALGIPQDSPCLNGGVLVMNLDCWRQEEITVRIFHYLKMHHDAVRFWDQDGLNAVLAGRWKSLSPMWNYRVDCSKVAQPGHDTPGDLNALARIVHFASAAKPWHYYCEHPARDLYFDYVDQTAWRGWRPKPPLKALLNRHYWGRKIRGVPFLGKAWAGWRACRTRVMKG